MSWADVFPAGNPFTVQGDKRPYHGPPEPHLRTMYCLHCDVSLVDWLVGAECWFCHGEVTEKKPQWWPPQVCGATVHFPTEEERENAA